MENKDESDVLFIVLKNFCEINEQFNVAFKATEKQKTLTRCEKNDLHVHYIARNILTNSEYCENVIDHFPVLLPRLVLIAINFDDKLAISQRQHLRNCILLGKLIRSRPDLAWYATKYCEKSPSPFSSNTEQVGRKKQKMSESVEISDLEFAEACYSLLRSNPNFFRKKWNWSEFLEKYLNNSNKEIQWISCHCLAIVTSMNELQLIELINTKMTMELHEQFTCKFDFSKTLQNPSKHFSIIDKNPCISLNKNRREEITEISGIYIPKLPSSEVNEEEENLIMVDSTYNNLRKIALSLTDGGNKAICLQGPVGSGKTSLIEHLARKTGRKLGENFIKVQLGDQTDSKMLLGTYRCTDIPGEFVWQPGVVTQAVIEGNWLLLEDIDSASVDIASVLSSLLENGTLTVPGYRDSLDITPGFQIFFTQRLVSTITGFHKKHSNSMTLLEKHLLQVNIIPLSSAELKSIVIKRHPQFSTIADRMLSVFHLFSSHPSNASEISIPKTSRLISTRDFFKWCTRAAIDFDISLQSSAMKVLQDAIDVFCCSFPKQDDALQLARQISTHLGIINEKAEFFFKSYKPNLQLSIASLTVGRGSIKRNNELLVLHYNYFFTRPSSVLLERIMCCVNLNEPVLLVGETGTGKTSSVQYLANTIGQKLIVINMNQQSDSADLLGGFKPVDLKFVINPVRKEFEAVFCDFFNIESNKLFLSHISHCFNRQRWSDLITLMTKSYESAISKLSTSKQTEKNTKIKQRWILLGQKLHKLSLQLKQKNALAFAFIEGSLVKAVEQGCWVLLDEINLANAETLECLSGLLEGTQSSLCLLERGDKQPVKRHKNFTLFACMNPSTDVGKKDLPPGLRNRFTEFYVDELTEKNDLHLLVGSYLNSLSLKEGEISRIVEFYLKVRRETETSLTDGLGHRPHFSLRSLCRALTITARNPCGMFKKSLYEAFSLSFLTQLDSASYSHVQKMIGKFLVGEEKLLRSLLKQPIPQPRSSSSEEFLQFEGYWIRKGNLESSPPQDYILTESVRKNLKDLVRIVSIGSLPVLLQGDTSVGKTSLITFLAKSSGNKCVRINNHEHTDLQEYIGSYIADSSGNLVFREGLLVEAMRQGHWIILDELNLAPSDVLEALNRVLDDNRELFIPETQETVKANKNFMLFATQNPPGSYGGRKMLSRAFRNRFVELHFNEIPPAELEFILHKRCAMAPSYASKMIKVMTELQMRRRGSAAFAGKQGFITLRDLFRWGERYRLAQNTDKLYDWDQHLADEGFLVLAGRVRRSEEKNEIISVLEKILKRSVNPNDLFTLSERTSTVTRKILERIEANKAKCKNIVFTYSMRQLVVLVAKAFEFKEPVLLVGETGGGKTTVCQLIAEQNSQKLSAVNCHMHTESSDFIGGLRPVRDHSNCDENENKLFEWVDGPLIHAMRNGDMFLADEISLADDSVLERLNSLLEPERTLLLAEKGHDLLIQANEKFYFIGTMNPGGDFGKKELSPALRNRFTEIWCEQCTARCDLVDIIEENIQERVCMGNQQDGSTGIGNNIMDFIEWFKKSEIGKRITVSIRDILTWVDFINKTTGKVDIFEAYLHGACLTFLDALGTGITSCENAATLREFRETCESFLKEQTHSQIKEEEGLVLEEKNGSFGIHPFYIENGRETTEKSVFSFNAPTTLFNTLRLLRGMQLNKAILLEGSPGVGKTSLVTALAKYSGHRIFRVNLSDQTDVSDLFGADLPVEGGKGGQFSWRDGPLLQALQAGDWILLDELNLASQSVLEGLNACLDHRGEVFIPELGKTFHLKAGTRFFACQNPQKQGGSRRGLPQSFLNRFIQVHVTSLTASDLELILKKQFGKLPLEVLTKMLEFNARVVEELENHSFGSRGAPWELNLRDLTRWCEATIYHFNNNQSREKQFEPESLVELIYCDRMRTVTDRERIREVFVSVFGRKVSGRAPVLYVNTESVFVGDVSLNRNSKSDRITYRENRNFVLRTQLAPLRSLAYCVNLNWMSLLVGGSASGKSTIVKVLANLAGKSLRTLPVTSAMDTTDILGGFEQTDYARHLEELVKETERILFENVREKLLKNDRKGCFELLALWESYWNIENDLTNKTMEEETKLFTQKLNKLERVWKVLPNTQELQQKSARILNSVRREKSLNAGGKFEWIDSVLIKCLQDGSWLLVDNVNLCSAAVLDRLNALLEPNGVLTVSERGVDENGRMVEVKPHPGFRLFLTMDPKNGEISRAMRNRGVEIFLLNETETNTFDLKSLISREGLPICHTEPLLRLHDFVSGLVLGEKPNVTELLRTSQLITKQLQNGYSVSRAFHSSIMEVYCANRARMEFSCDDFSTVLAQEIERILHEKKEKGVFFADSVTLKTDALQKCSRLEQIKQQCSFLLGILDNNSLELISDRVCYFFVHFYSTSSLDELHIRHLYLTSRLQESDKRLLANNLHTFVQTNAELVQKNFPLDSRWIPETHFAAKNDFKSNLLVVALHFVANLVREQSNSTRIEKEMSQNLQVSLREYMLRRSTKKIDDQFNDTLVEKMLELIESFNNFFLDSLQNISELTDAKVVEILELLAWRFILSRCSLVNVKKINTNQRNAILTSLKVHYCWFLKHSVTCLRSLLDSKLPKKLQEIVEEINRGLENEFSKLHKFARRFQKQNSPPLPLTSREKIDFSQKIHKLTRDSSVCNRQNSSETVFLTLQENPEFRRELIRARVDGKELGFEEFPAAKTQLNKYAFDLIPVIDCFLKISVRESVLARETSEELNCTAILPVDLIAAMQLCKQDKRFEHELTTCFFGYLMNSMSATNLHCFNPILINHMTNLLISDESRIITPNLGNFQHLFEQHSQLNQILWQNCQQLQQDDFITTETRFVQKSFADFAATLASSLNIKSDERNVAEKCFAKLSVLGDGESELNFSFLAHFRNCLANFSRISESSEDFNTKIMLLGELHMELSYVKAVLNSRLALIDPSAKKTLKRKYCTESVSSFEQLQDSFLSLNQVFSASATTLHSHYSHVERMIEKLKARSAELGAYVAVRPEAVPYEEVAKSVNHGFETILSCKYVDRIVSGLNNSIKKLLEGQVEKSEIVLNQYESSVSSFENLICEWEKYRCSYPDVIEPLLSNVTEFLYGFKLNLGLVKRLLAINQEVDAQTRLVKLVQLPGLDQSSQNYQLLIDSYTDKSFFDFVRTTSGCKREILRLSKCGIQESFNNCLIEANTRGTLTGKIFAQFESLIESFIVQWNQQEADREQQEQEADSLYKTKTKCDDKTEDEQIAAELKQLFPNYHEEDFADMQKSANLLSSSAAPPSQASNEFSGLIGLEDIKFVVDLHLILLKSFTRTEWLNPRKNKDAAAAPNFVNPLVEKFKVFKLIFNKQIYGLDYKMNADLLESLAVLLGYVQNCGDVHSLLDQFSPSKTSNRYDFYKDSNVEEVKSAFHVLEALKKRILELLDEWPDQPTLKSIVVVIERVCSFDVASPLARFLTAFEILLSKCHEWEEVAHSGVSLSEHSQILIQQIIVWRKIELSVWKDLLNATFQRLNEPIYKYWLFLYNIMEQYTRDESISELELIETLQNYVSKSNLAEFQNRLRLLYVFHCHAVHLKRTNKSKTFINILWNIYCYFEQFASNVANKIKDLRAPIEKKLKDYVKIVKWKDINYWSIKETVDKTHKTLHKYVREFQDVLRLNVSTAGCLVNTPNANKSENVGIWDRPQRREVKTYHYTLDPETYICKEATMKRLSPRKASHKQLLHKIDALFADSRKLCKESMSAMKYPKLVQSLDSFVTEIIETSSHLQTLDVDTSLEKKKQKSQAKSILNRKHRALADLFKTLTKIGLSYKSGLVQSKLKMGSEEFLMKPIDISANFSHIDYKRKDQKILTIWDSCEMYYLKSLMRADVLHTALKTPAQDLGLQNIERCRGFSSNLLTLVQRQKAQLKDNSITFYYLRHYTTQMTRISESKHFLPLATVETIENFINNITITTAQTKIFLNTCPTNTFGEVHTVFVLKPQPHFIQYKNDELWSRASLLINDIQSIANKIAVELEKARGDVPSVEFNLIKLNYVPIADLSAFQNKFNEIHAKILQLTDIFGQIRVAKSFAFLSSETERIISTLSAQTSYFECDVPMKKLQKLASSLSSTIFEVIEQVSLKYTSNQEDCLQEIDEETHYLEEEHLRKLIVENLERDLKELDMFKILELCHRIAKILFVIPPHLLDEPKSLISFILPLLEQVMLFYQYVLTQQVSAYRVSCKLSSILLNIFIDLASKGFCVPPELSDEEQGVGKATDGMGLGEGQGERDVSDKIESEDQLEDAQPAGQEKEQQQNEDPDCKEEEKGIEMSEDFDSKLQDLDKKDNKEDSEDENDNSDADEQMGDTEKDASKKDKETFGSDNEEEEETSEEQGDKKEEKGEGGEKEGESELAAKEKDKSKNSEEPDKDSGREKEENKKEINEMEEPEFDDEQTDPYHGNQPELPEPEAMDLPDDFQLDDGQENENEGPEGEENPFDIDAMKEDNPFEDKKDDENQQEENENRDEADEFSSDDEDANLKQDDDQSTEEKSQKEESKTQENEAEDTEPEDSAKTEEESGLDQTQTNEDHVEAMEVDETPSAADKTQNQAENQKSKQSIEDLCQEDKPDRDGVGQSQMEESSTGHSAQTSTPQETQSSKREREEEVQKPQQQKIGDSDSQRSLGNVDEPVKKKLKTMDAQELEENSGEDGEEKDETEAEMYKHIKESSEKASDTQILDVATKEQADKQEILGLEEEKEEVETENPLEMEKEEQLESTDAEIQKAEKLETDETKKKSEKKQHPDGDILEEIQEVEIEGEIIETLTVQRGSETTYNTLYDNLKAMSAARLTQEEMNSIRKDVELQLSAWNETPSDAEADRTWQKISSVTSALAQDLSEQLRLVLEPTLASRLKGDFRTGRRINMRKVIPYIASQFRKDKIWLRRTKPSKREYQIVLAIDDSSSMSDNHSKELAFESVALISKALTLLESGQLSVVSFGESTEILHRLTDQFTERSGVKLLQKFRFDQNKTCVAKLVDFVNEMLDQSQMQSSGLNAKLLVVVSDGRGVFSEGEAVVRQAVRRAKLCNVFMVFVIIDNPENKHSILDIRMPVFKDGKMLNMQNYMDVFPFSFYIVLRDINSLPSVLSDALRQWFEVVSNLDKQ